MANSDLLVHVLERCVDQPHWINDSSVRDGGHFPVVYTLEGRETVRFLKMECLTVRDQDGNTFEVRVIDTTPEQD